MMRWKMGISVLGLASSVLLAAQQKTGTTQTAPAAAPALHGLWLQGSVAAWQATADTHMLHQLRTDVDAQMRLHPTSSVEALSYAPALLALYRFSPTAAQWSNVEALHDALLVVLKKKDPLSPEQRYEAALFLTEYAATVHSSFQESKDLLLSDIPRDAANGAVSANPAWDVLSLVDVLSWIPEGNEEHAALLAVLQQRAPKDWKPSNQIVDDRLQAYAVLKAVRLGYLPQSLEEHAVQFATSLHATAAVDTPTSAEAGAALFLESELGQTETEAIAQGKVVAVDGWFNSQKQKDPKGNAYLFHYKWEEDGNPGFSFFGRAFQRYGAKLSTIAEEPTLDNLKGAAVYVIVSPDTPEKNPAPHYVEKQDVEAITTWVNNGGVLVLMMNDSANTEFVHLNTLSERFGIHFNPTDVNPVDGTKWQQGSVLIPESTGVFAYAHHAYMKDICTISTLPPSQPVLRDLIRNNGDVFMAVSHYGKGTVYAVVDPWLYNEYTDGRKLPAEFDQFAAAKDLAGWLLSQTH